MSETGSQDHERRGRESWLLNLKGGLTLLYVGNRDSPSSLHFISSSRYRMYFRYPTCRNIVATQHTFTWSRSPHLAPLALVSPSSFWRFTEAL